MTDLVKFGNAFDSTKTGDVNNALKTESVLNSFIVDAGMGKSTTKIGDEIAEVHGPGKLDALKNIAAGITIEELQKNAKVPGLDPRGIPSLAKGINANFIKLN